MENQLGNRLRRIAEALRVEEKELLQPRQHKPNDAELLDLATITRLKELADGLDDAQKRTLVLKIVGAITNHSP